MNNSKTFRLFISSTFSDFKKEREILHKNVFPKIEAYCIENNLVFQPVDLRWGVNNEAQLDQKTLEICLEEVKACKHFPHPNFLIMAGDRYGYVPCPYMIEEKEFEDIVKYIEKVNRKITIEYKPELDSDKQVISQKDPITVTKLELLRRWYSLDKNQIYLTSEKKESTAYILQVREDDYKIYVNWEAEEIALREILQEAVKHINLSKEDKEYLKYFQSATEQEVIEGICEYKEKTEAQEGCNGGIDKKYVFGYMRTIENAHGDYIDSAKNKETVDELKREAKRFKDDLQRVLNKSNILEKELSAFKSIKDYEESELVKFEEYIIKKLKDSIDKQIPDNKNLSLEEKKKINLSDEISEQQKFLKEKVKGFQGRKATLNKIENYLKENDTTEPLIIHGLSGMGKSSLMAKAICNMSNNCAETHKTIETDAIFRFVGSSANSTTIRNLLISIVYELQNKKIIEEVEGYETDNNKFDTQIKKIFSSIEKETIIFIDALDQLQHINYLNWLPAVLPPELKIILSVINDKNYDKKDRKEGTHYYSRLKQIYTNEKRFIDITDDSLEEQKTTLIEALLNAEHRKLNKTQTVYLIDKWAETRYSPLYLKIAIEEVKHWKNCEDKKSDTDDQSILCEKQKLENSVEGIILEYLTNLDELYHHEELLIEKVFGYIHASRDGLSERELLHILSEDLENEQEFRDAIINEYHNAIKVNNPRNNNKAEHILPTSIWSRLHTQIKPFIVERTIDNQPLMKFFHRQFTSVIEDRYKKDKEKLHTRLASYFSTLQNETKLWDERYHNQHMLDELPYQLFHANNPEGLKNILFDLEFAGSIYDNQKQDSFRQILERSIELDDISSDEVYPWESFYREREHLILSEKDRVLDLINPTSPNEIKLDDNDTISISFPNFIEWENHKSLFCIAYEDGDNSPISHEAKKLLENNRICWSFLKRKDPNENMQRSGLEKAYMVYQKYDEYILLKNNTLCLIGDKSMLINKNKVQQFSWKFKFKYDNTRICAIDEKSVYQIDYQGVILNSYNLSDEEFVIAYFRNNETYIITRKLVSSENYLLILDKDYNLLSKYKLMSCKEIRSIEILSMGILLDTFIYYDNGSVMECIYFDFTTEKCHSLFGDYSGFVGHYETTSYEFIEEKKKKIIFIKKEPYEIDRVEGEVFFAEREYVSTVDLSTFEVVDNELGDKKNIYGKKKQNTPLSLVEKEKTNLQNGKYFIVENNIFKFFNKNKIGLSNNTIKIKYELLPNKAVVFAYNNTVYLFNFKELKKLDEEKFFKIQDGHIEVNEKIFDINSDQVDTKYKLNDQYYLSLSDPCKLRDLSYEESIDLDLLFEDDLDDHILDIVNIYDKTRSKIEIKNIYPKNIKKKWASRISLSSLSLDEPTVTYCDKIVLDEYAIPNNNKYLFIVFWINYDEFMIFKYESEFFGKYLYSDDSLCHYKFVDYMWVDIKRYGSRIKEHYIDEQQLPYFTDVNCDGKLLYISEYPYGLYISNCDFSILDIQR